MTLQTLIKRNIKVYFKDKGVFFPSLITPLILLVLFVTFLKNVYIDSLKMQLPESIVLSKTLLNGFAGSWLISSLLATSCITIAFCANMVMVQDKVNGNFKDLTIAPIKISTLNLSYYIATAIVTLLICYVTLFVGLFYLSFVGFYLSFLDVLLTFVDVFLLVLFGTALSSLVCRFLKSQGAISAVASLVSTIYGFICGAYMPISQFGKTLQNILMFFPGTYGTGLIRKHMTRGIINEFAKNGIGNQTTEAISKSFDLKLTFFNNNVSELAMYLVLISTICVLVLIFLVLNYKIKKVRHQHKIKTMS